MSPPARLALVDAAEPTLSIVAQCRLLRVARSTLYYQPVPVSADDLAVMRRMDELYLAHPFYGSRRMAAMLRRDSWGVNRKRVSITMDAEFCVEALRDAMGRHGRPEIFNTDQGSQFTSADFVGELAGREV